MRQNIGILLLTIGSVLLGINIFKFNLQKFLNFGDKDWHKVPWEVRFFCKYILRIKNYSQYLEKLFKLDVYPSPDDKLELGKRLTIDMPIIALLLMIIGMFLCFNYSAI